MRIVNINATELVAEENAAIAESARYVVGDLPCVEGECDDAESDGAPCPLLQTRYATADDVLERDRLRDEVRDKGNDLLAVRGILSPNGQPRRVPMPLGDSVAPAVQWLVDEVERLRAAGELYCDYGYPVGGGQPRVNWCGLGRGHAGWHVGGAVGVSFTDVGTVRRGGVS